MKQHITVKQLDELSKKGINNLKKWWKPEWWHLFVWTKEGLKGINGDGGVERGAENMLWTNYTTNPKNSKGYQYIVEHKNKGWILPVLSIGQMIEFLDGYGLDDVGHSGRDWAVNMYTIRGKINKELCDALWEVVKELLNEQRS